MEIAERKYGLFDILSLPLKCAPISTILIGTQRFFAGIIPSIQILVTAKFIDTSISIVGGYAHINSIYPSLFGIIAMIAFTWISGMFTKFAEISRGRTSIIVTHRLGSAKIADRIIVMDCGRIVEIGTHDELLYAGGKYAKMFNAQAGWYAS